MSDTHEVRKLGTQWVHSEKKAIKKVSSLSIIKLDTQWVHAEKKAVKKVSSLSIIKLDT